MYTTLCEDCEYQNEEDEVLVLKEHRFVEETDI